jgi:threonyl-tRNA synthetase
MVALLLEYFDGQLPGWLSPIQVMILPLSFRENQECHKFRDILMNAGIRVKVDENQGSLSKRVLFAHKFRPFAKLIIGPREISSGLLRLEFRDGKKEGEINSLINILKESCSIPK